MKIHLISSPSIKAIFKTASYYFKERFCFDNPAALIQKHTCRHQRWWIFCHICANRLNILVLKAKLAGSSGTGQEFLQVARSRLAQLHGGWKCDMKYCQGWFRAHCGSPPAGPVQSWELIHHPLHQEENDDSGSCRPWSWSSVDNDGKRFKEAGPDWLGGWEGSQVRCCCCCTLLKILEPRRLIVHRKSIYLAKYTYIHIFCIYLNTGTRMLTGQNKVNIKN